MGDRRVIAGSGIAGSLALTIYFAAPAILGWPYGGAGAPEIATYASSHATLFYAGAWFQATGTLLSIAFFIGIAVLAGRSVSPPGIALIVGATSLLVVVLVEAAFLVAVPAAADAGDLATVATAFALSNGTFARVFALGPAPATYVALGVVLRGSAVISDAFAWAALVLGGAFALAGLLAVFTPAGVILTIVLSVTQELWIIAAAIALLRPRT